MRTVWCVLPARAYGGCLGRQQGIHPDYHPVEVTCSCGNTFVTRTAGKEDHMFVDVCSQCHPFYTGKQKILDTGGRVARFEKRYGKKSK